MAIVANFKLSWQIVKASWAVLTNNKSLFIFPLLSGIFSLVVVSVVLGGAYVLDGFEELQNVGTISDEQALIVGLISLGTVFIMYLTSYTLIYFFNVALGEEILETFAGKQPSVGRGISTAMGQLGNIIGYALIAATVGAILNAIKKRSRGGISQIGGSFIELGWSIATFFVVPIMVINNVGPIDAIKQSFAMMKSSLGKQVTGNLTLGVIFLLPILVILGAAGGVIYLTQDTAQETIGMIGGIAFGVIALSLLNILQTAIEQVFRIVLYKHLQGEQVPGYFDGEALQALKG